MSEHVPVQMVMSEGEARRLTEEVKADAAALWAKLLRLYDGKAHAALGYSSWADYCGAEFNYGRSRSYQLLESARVVERVQHVGLAAPRSDRVARELTPLLDRPEEMAAAWQEANAEAAEQGGPVTARVAREAVQRRTRPRAPEPAEPERDPTDGPLDELEKVMDSHGLAKPAGPRMHDGQSALIEFWDSSHALEFLRLVGLTDDRLDEFDRADRQSLACRALRWNGDWRWVTYPRIVSAAERERERELEVEAEADEETTSP